MCLLPPSPHLRWNYIRAHTHKKITPKPSSRSLLPQSPISPSPSPPHLPPLLLFPPRGRHRKRTARRIAPSAGTNFWRPSQPWPPTGSTLEVLPVPWDPPEKPLPTTLWAITRHRLHLARTPVRGCGSDYRCCSYSRTYPRSRSHYFRRHHRESMPLPMLPFPLLPPAGQGGSKRALHGRGTCSARKSLHLSRQRTQALAWRTRAPCARPAILSGKKLLISMKRPRRCHRWRGVGEEHNHWRKRRASARRSFVSGKSKPPFAGAP